MDELSGLIEKHRSKPVLVDSNLLVLLLIGRLDPRQILTHKRTQAYTQDDYWLLESLLGYFGEMVTTPHVLAQASDLAVVPGRKLTGLRSLFRMHVEQVQERYDESRVLVHDPCFERLGLTDAAIATLASGGVLVITADLDLYVALQQRRIDCLNFNHLRPYGWRG